MIKTTVLSLVAAAALVLCSCGPDNTLPDELIGRWRGTQADFPYYLTFTKTTYNYYMHVLITGTIDDFTEDVTETDDELGLFKSGYWHAYHIDGDQLEFHIGLGSDKPELDDNWWESDYTGWKPVRE